MLKALLKKQFLELTAFYFQNRKTGKRRSKGGSVGFILLYVFIYAMVAFSLVGVSFLMGDSLLGSASKEWIYFAIMGMLAILLGTFGSVFSTYTGLYLAKDNELLLSLPIPAGKLLLSRMAGVYAMSFLYSGLAWIPAIVVSWILRVPTVACVVSDILLSFILALFVTVLTCLFGWLVALLAGKLKGKNIFAVILSLLFFAGYYYVCFNMNSLLQSLAANSERIGTAIRAKVYVIYQLGLGAAGSVPAFLLFTAIVLVLFALCMFILSKTFRRILSANHGTVKAEYKEKTVKNAGYRAALLRRERMRFTGSTAYMLNAGLGIVILLVLPVLALIKAALLRQTLEAATQALTGTDALLTVLIPVIVCAIVSMNAISASSVSLEGKNIWITQTLPVGGRDVLQAKERFHTACNLLPALLCTVVTELVAGTKLLPMLLSVVLVSVYVVFTADLGLALNLKLVNLDWTNEAVPIKQGGPVGIVLFGGWLLSLLMGIPYFFLRDLLAAPVWLLCWTCLFAAAVLLLRRWLGTKGAEIFEHL